MSLKLEDSTFTRNSTAYDYNFSVCGINEPRFVPGKFGNGLLIEEGTTNLTPSPNDFTLWNKARATVTSNAAVAPDGTLTADKIICTGENDPFIYRTYTYGTSLANQTFTWSVWCWTDAGQPTEMTLFLYDSTVTYIKSQTFVMTTTPQRYSVTYTFPAGCTATSLMYRVDPQSVSPPANAYLYVWGAQLEQKRYATSFTNSARSSETLDIPLSHLNPGMWTIEMWIKQTLTSPIVFSHGRRLLDLGGFWLWNFSPSWTDTSNRRIIADFGNDANGTRQFLDLNGTAFSTTTFEHLAVTFDGVTFKFYRNGTLWNSKTPALINAFTKIQLASACWIIDDLRISNIVRTSFDLSMALVDSNTTYKLDFDNKTRIYPTRIESNEFVEGDGPYFTYDGLHWQDIEEYINPLHIDNTIWCNEIIENSTLQSNDAHIQCGEIIENQALGFNGNIITCGEWIEHMDIDGEEISWLSQTEVQTREILRAHEIEEC